MGICQTRLKLKFTNQVFYFAQDVDREAWFHLWVARGGAPWPLRAHVGKLLRRSRCHAQKETGARRSRVSVFFNLEDVLPLIWIPLYVKYPICIIWIQVNELHFFIPLCIVCMHLYCTIAKIYTYRVKTLTPFSGSLRTTRRRRMEIPGSFLKPLFLKFELQA